VIQPCCAVLCCAVLCCAVLFLGAVGLQDRFIMFRDMHLTRNKQLSRLHERWARLNKQRMDDNDRRLEALKANDFEAYKELLRQTYGPSTDDERFAGQPAELGLYVCHCMRHCMCWCVCVTVGVDVCAPVGV